MVLIHVLGPCWFLLSVLMATALMVPAVGVDSLLCYYCPLQHKDKSCPNITSQCLPDQRCSISWGFYGSIHIVSAQRCVNKQLCGSKEKVSYRGVKYDVRHKCCCRDTCNTAPKGGSDSLPPGLF
uniref:UPAR/Ly6 domain-containing protein n=1 Tax=Sphaeramia orbicularis TaxID=375764 RepID=A0A672ZLK8_9TELE